MHFGLLPYYWHYGRNSPTTISPIPRAALKKETGQKKSNPVRKWHMKGSKTVRCKRIAEASGGKKIKRAATLVML